MDIFEGLIHSDPEIMSGTRVFVGTRVPVKTFFDYLREGESVEVFLDHFPTVQKEQIEELLDRVQNLAIGHADSIR